MTACGVAMEEVVFFSDTKPGTYLAFGRMDDPDFWFEFSVTWLSLGADRIVSVFTADNDRYLGLMVGASAGALVLRGLRIGLDRWHSAIDSLVFLMKNFTLFEAVGSRGVWERYLLDAKGHQRPFTILDDHVEPVEDIADVSIRSESRQLESLANASCLLCVTCLSRDVSHFKMLAIVLRRVHGV